ncbi:hypothetical protein bcgnr5406_27960 [Bacillus cereus]
MNNIRLNMNKILIVNAVLFIYSYVLEAIFFTDFDLTIPFFLICIILICANIIYSSKIIRLNSTDWLIIILVIYIYIHSIFISSPIIASKIVIGAIAAYFLGRYIIVNAEFYKTFHLSVNVASWMMIIALIVQYINSDTRYRVVIGDTHPVALGELIGIFVITNFFNASKAQKPIFSYVNAIIGLFVMFVILGSRGAVISTVCSILLIYVLKANIKKKFLILVTSIVAGCSYLFLFTTDSVLVKEFPSLYRFTLEGMLNDPSLTGSYQYIGRRDVYTQSIEFFKENPILGKGLGSVYSHNIMLEFASTLGIVGLVIFLVILLLLTIKATKVLRSGEYLLVALFLQSLIYRQSSFSLEHGKSLFFFGGLLVAFYTTQKILNLDETTNPLRKSEI